MVNFGLLVELELCRHFDMHMYVQITMLELGHY